MKLKIEIECEVETKDKRQEVEAILADIVSFWRNREGIDLNDLKISEIELTEYTQGLDMCECGHHKNLHFHCHRVDCKDFHCNIDTCQCLKFNSR